MSRLLQANGDAVAPFITEHATAVRGLSCCPPPPGRAAGAGCHVDPAGCGRYTVPGFTTALSSPSWCAAAALRFFSAALGHPDADRFISVHDQKPTLRQYLAARPPTHALLYAPNGFLNAGQMDGGGCAAIPVRGCINCIEPWFGRWGAWRFYSQL